MVGEAWAGTPGRDELDFEDRAVRLENTAGGAGVVRGDLTPACAAALGSVLESLSAPAGAEDTRSQRQRYHDALEEAMRRLMADPGATVTREWIGRARARWAAARAAASVAGGDGGAWLGGAGFACGASITPVVTGDVDPGALEDLVRLCAELAGYGLATRTAAGAAKTGPGRGRLPGTAGRH